MDVFGMLAMMTEEAERRDAAPTFPDAPTWQRFYTEAELGNPPTDPPLPPPTNTATHRAGRLQAGTVRAGDLTLYYSYATLIGGLVDGQSPIFTDAYYSVRTEEHARLFGREATGAIVLPDPAFRRALTEVCRTRGFRPPVADFTHARETSFPNSGFFGQKPERGQRPKAGSYVYVLRDIAHRPDADLCHGYRVKCLYYGLVKAADSDRGWEKGQRLIRPAYLGYGTPTEAVDADQCQTEGGGQSFPGK